MRLPILALGGFSLAVSASGLYRTSRFPAEVVVPIEPFSYTGRTGPLNWYGINKTGNGLCDMGRTQSPININTAELGKAVKLVHGSTIKLDIPNVDSAEFENIGSTVEVVCNGTLNDNGKIFKLVQFHYHTPSEHRIDDEYFPVEQHFLFEAADATLAALTFFIDIDDNNYTGPLSREVLRDVDAIAKPGSSTKVGPLVFKPLLAHLHRNNVYRYEGSLTSPPCIESFRWIISAEPVTMDVASYKRLRKVLKFNSRYTQDSHGSMNLLERAAKELRPS